MRLYRRKEECCGCGACADVCQTGAVRMAQDEEGFFYPVVEKGLCTGCGRCKTVCPVKHYSPGRHKNRYIGARAKDDGLRLESSSGGVFPVLAEAVLKQGGAAYGAGFNSRMEVVHQRADTKEALEALKKTKYVQSSMQGIYRDIRQSLQEKRPVLFCGTPCQAKALKLYLGDGYGDRLIIADLVCYGVPSPGIWADYVKDLNKKRRGRMVSFSFRDKRAGDHGHTCAYEVNGKEYACSLFRDKFCTAYFKNYTLRPSCYSCRFCTVNRDSDFTIGDFWGIEKVRPDLDDGFGMSMVILRTERAKKLWEQVKDRMDWFECGKEALLQPRLAGPTARAKGRGLYMALYRRVPFSLFFRVSDAFLRIFHCISRWNPLK